jgi:hypothetical protein
VVEVAPLALDLLVPAPQPADRLRPATAAARAPGNLAVCLRQPLLGRAAVARVRDAPLSAVMRNMRSPTSMPVSRPVGGRGCTGTSAQAMHAYHPSASRLMVTVLGVPCKYRCTRIGMRPSLDRLSTPPSSTAPLPYWG